MFARCVWYSRTDYLHQCIQDEERGPSLILLHFFKLIVIERIFPAILDLFLMVFPSLAFFFCAIASISTIIGAFVKSIWKMYEGINHRKMDTSSSQGLLELSLFGEQARYMTTLRPYPLVTYCSSKRPDVVNTSGS